MRFVITPVKTTSLVTKTFRCATLSSLVLIAGASMSCMTTYDEYGRPMQTVDPAVAVAGAVAAGTLGYALANDNHHHHNNHYYYGGGGYYRGGGHHRYHR